MNLQEIFTVSNILSLAFYLAVFFISAYFIHIGAKSKQPRVSIIGVLLIAIVCGFRYQVGIDYESYVRHVNNLSNVSISEYLSSNLINIFEPTFLLISKLSLASENQAILFFFITSLLTVGFYYLGSRRYTSTHVALLFLTIILTTLPKDLSGVRQGVAVAIGYYAISFLLSKNPIKFFALIGVAGMFHYSAFILLAIYPAYHLIYLNKIKNYATKISLLLSATLGSILVLIKNLHNIPFFGRYAYLLDPEKIISASGSPNIISKVLPVIATLPYMRRLIKQDKNNAFIFFLASLPIMFMIIGLFAGPLYRIGNYFIPFFAILFVNIVDLHNGKRRKSIVKLILLYSVLFFIGSNFIRNSYGIFPYQFILF